jgi:hypothetical protein
MRAGLHSPNLYATAAPTAAHTSSTTSTRTWRQRCEREGRLASPASEASPDDGAPPKASFGAVPCHGRSARQAQRNARGATAARTGVARRRMHAETLRTLARATRCSIRPLTPGATHAAAYAVSSSGTSRVAERCFREAGKLVQSASVSIVHGKKGQSNARAVNPRECPHLPRSGTALTLPRSQRAASTDSRVYCCYLLQHVRCCTRRPAVVRRLIICVCKLLQHARCLPEEHAVRAFRRRGRAPGHGATSLRAECGSDADRCTSPPTLHAWRPPARVVLLAAAGTCATCAPRAPPRAAARCACRMPAQQ